MTLSAVVVDDEAPARKRLRDLISEEAGIDLVAECDDGPSAVEAIRSLAPDVIFLDVQMPEMDGFEVLDVVGVEAVGSVVFVTAYDEYAVRAFEARAVDYLLKPFTRERFRETLDRLRSGRSEHGEIRRRLEHLLADRPVTADRIAVKDGGRIRLLRAGDIDWIEADGNYVRLHSGAREHRVRGTLKRLTRRLSALRFVRIHHSYVVNLDRVRELRPWTHGELVVVLESGKELVTSRTYSGALRALVRGEAT